MASTKSNVSANNGSSSSSLMRKRPRLATNQGNVEASVPRKALQPAIPVITDRPFGDAFRTYQAVHLPQLLRKVPATTSHLQSHLTWKDLRDLFDSLGKDDQDSWCMENGASKKDGDEKMTPHDFLQPVVADPTHHRRYHGYCSFLVQNDKSAMTKTLSRLPLSDLPWTQEDESELRYGPCLWFFFGRNSSSEHTDDNDLEGRPEHTDSVSHDGTWHYQLSGRKTWYLRPTTLLLQHMKDHLGEEEYKAWSDDESFSIGIDCQEGDVLVLNTRLWWHRTVIPSQSVPSVSYARDFFLTSNKTSDAPYVDDSATSNDKEETMTNVDGLYAANNIEEGMVLFTENDMPNCELHRSSIDPNCEIVELEDGTSAVVSCRDIAAGEFFCVPESDEEEYEESEEDDE